MGREEEEGSVIDRVLSDHVGTVVQTQTIDGREWWLYNAWCARCDAELCRLEVRQTFWEDAPNARSLMCWRILEEIKKRACKCCHEYVPDFDGKARIP